MKGGRSSGCGRGICNIVVGAGIAAWLLCQGVAWGVMTACDSTCSWLGYDRYKLVDAAICECYDSTVPDNPDQEN